MKNPTFIVFSFLFTLLLLEQVTYARPEYAAGHTYVSCTACHVSAFGGGIRTLDGKLYGARDYALGEFSKKNWYQLDVRNEILHSKTTTVERQGMIVMNAIGTIYVPVTVNSETDHEDMGLILSNNFGLLGQGLAEAFVVYNFQTSFGQQQLSFGRFHVPYGLLTDEHRTYVRMQSSTTIKDYDSGFALSGDVGSVFHYDLGVTTGFDNGGQTFSTSTHSQTKNSDDSPYGLFANLRYNPLRAPMYFGLSYKTDRSTRFSTPFYSESVYGAFSTTKISNGYVPGSLLFEVEKSSGWNNTAISAAAANIGNFIDSNDTAWSEALAGSTAQGLLMQFNYEMSRHWVLLYKQEQFTPDINYSGDTFYRYGGGAKYFINANSDLNLRYEHSRATRPGYQEAGTVNGTADFIYVLLHLWI